MLASPPLYAFAINWQACNAIIQINISGKRIELHKKMVYYFNNHSQKTKNRLKTLRHLERLQHKNSESL